MTTRMTQHFANYNSKALEGFLLVLNNNLVEAEIIFMKSKDQSNLMSAGASLVLTLEFFLSNASKKHRMATETSIETIRRCKASNKLLRNSNNPSDITDFIANEILSSQCQLYLAILSVACGTDVLSSCWTVKQVFQLHKKSYKEIVDYARHMASGVWNLENPKHDSLPTHLSMGNSSTMPQTRKSYEEFSSDFLSMIHLYDIDESLALPERQGASGMIEFFRPSRPAMLFSINVLSLMICGRNCTNVALDQRCLSMISGMVSLGHGLFLMAIHLMPQSTSLQLLTFLFGLHDDQTSEGEQNMIKKFMLASLSDSCFAPFACCILLHFLTVRRPLMVMNSNNLTSEELPRIELLLHRMEKLDAAKSMFYFYFQGKYHLIKENLEVALKSFKLGVENAPGDFKFICQYELCRCSMAKHDWLDAAMKLDEVRREMPIIIVYHIYVTAVAYGAAGKAWESNKLLAEIRKHLKNKGKETSEYFGRRVCLWLGQKGSGSTSDVCLLLCFELLYIWNFLHVCSMGRLEAMLRFCQQQKNSMKNAINQSKDNKTHSFLALCLLLEGVISKELQNKNKHFETNKNTKMEVEKLFVESLDASRSDSSRAEEYVASLAAYELGLLHLEMGSFKRSRQYFVEARNCDPQHFFFKSKISNELEKMFSKPTLNHPSLDVSIPLEGTGSPVRRSVASRLRDFFFRNKERVSPVVNQSFSKPSEEFNDSPLPPSGAMPKFFSRKCLVRLNGENENEPVLEEGSDGVIIPIIAANSTTTTTKSCTIQ